MISARLMCCGLVALLVPAGALSWGSEWANQAQQEWEFERNVGADAPQKKPAASGWSNPSDPLNDIFQLNVGADVSKGKREAEKVQKVQVAAKPRRTRSDRIREAEKRTGQKVTPDEEHLQQTQRGTSRWGGAKKLIAMLVLIIAAADLSVRDQSVIVNSLPEIMQNLKDAAAQKISDLPEIEVSEIMQNLKDAAAEKMPDVSKRWNDVKNGADQMKQGVWKNLNDAKVGADQMKQEVWKNLNDAKVGVAQMKQEASQWWNDAKEGAAQMKQGVSKKWKDFTEDVSKKWKDFTEDCVNVNDYEKHIECIENQSVLRDLARWATRKGQTE